MIPLKTDRPLRRIPYVNHALIMINMAVFIFQGLASDSVNVWIDLNLVQCSIPYPVWDGQDHIVGYAQPHVWQFVTSTFLHADMMHLLGNMLFLWVFGNVIEDRLGHVQYALFYLGGGVFASIGHVLSSSNPALGASGAISAVTGLFLVLFPRTNVRVLWLFFVISIMEIPSVWFIGIAIARDIFMQLTPGERGVAYMAHLTGNMFGIVVGLGVLWLRILPREPCDLFTAINQWNRRRQFRAITRQGNNPWQGQEAKKSSAFQPQQNSEGNKRASNITDNSNAPLSASDQEQITQRQRILKAIGDDLIPDAANHFRTMLDEFPDTILSESAQLTMANQFFAEQDYAQAAIAYRRLLATYPGVDPDGEKRLMLGLTLGRYLHEPTEASAILEEALLRLPAGPNHDLAQELLVELGNASELEPPSYVDEVPNDSNQDTLS